MYFTSLLGRFAKKIASASGHTCFFVIVMLMIVAWAVIGPVVHFSDTWPLVINASTTIETFFMVFLIQHT